MSCYCFCFRPSMEIPAHQRAWELLQSIPKRKKTDYIVSLILQANGSFPQTASDPIGKSLSEAQLRRILREELQKAGFPTESEKSDVTPSVPASARPKAESKQRERTVVSAEEKPETVSEDKSHTELPPVLMNLMGSLMNEQD